MAQQAAGWPRQQLAAAGQPGRQRNLILAMFFLAEEHSRSPPSPSDCDELATVLSDLHKALAALITVSCRPKGSCEQPSLTLESVRRVL